MGAKGKIAVVVLASAMVIGACALPSLGVMEPLANPTAVPLPPVAVSPTEQVLPSLPTGTGAAGVEVFQDVLEGIYRQVSPSVVIINVTEEASAGSGQGFFPFFGQAPQSGQAQQELASGFVWDNRGDIVTNNHVIDGAATITVSFSDGTQATGSMIGADPNSDLAVVRVNVGASLLHPVQMGDSSNLQVGQIVIAIGNPFGEQNTMTEGVVSALGRTLPVQGGTTAQGTYSIPDVIQTDAPINPGNSGGVLLDVMGKVVGVTSAIESPVEASSGIGFAIPVNIVKRVVPVLIQQGHYAEPYLGISGTDLTSDLAQAMGLPGTTRGALVETVAAGGPADRAGVQASNQQVSVEGQTVPVGGDVIVGINGSAVRGIDEVISYLANNTQVGQTVTLTVLRKGKSVNLSVTLGSRPAG
ncbi:MAG: trypsin-like peptidase domain-containing protein [Anaerolineales bacterium]|jgi:S1-C subfamily serine protease